MARAQARLSARLCAAIEKPGLYGDGGGLYLHVGPTGGKSWIFRFMLNGRPRSMGLGPYPDISLAEARDLAATCRRQKRDGHDPIEARRAERQKAKLEAAKAMTFKACAEAYIKAHQAGWRNEVHARQWPSTLAAYVYPIFGDLPVQAVDTALVMKAIEPIWTEKPETASRVRGRIESVLDWATASGFRQGDNPARWRGHLANLLAPKTKVAKAKRAETGRSEHHAALPYDQIAAFMTKLRVQEGVAARALEFAILTGGRTGEVIGATWNEIDLAARHWTIPAGRMKKADKAHRVPLSEAALAILDKMAAIREGEFVFPSDKAGRSISNMAMLMLLRRMGHGDVTVHGFRSTFRDWAGDCTRHAREDIEMSLAHVIAGKSEAAYWRSDLFDKRRRLMDAWAKFCAAPPTPATVVPLRKPLPA